MEYTHACQHGIHTCMLTDVMRETKLRSKVKN